MQAREIMSSSVVFCTPEDTVQQAAQHMVNCGCGMVPVVDNPQDMKLVGVITDRDITCRVVATGMDCVNTTVSEAMSTDKLWTVSPNDTVDMVIDKMEEGSVRRLVVVDHAGKVQGIISVADVARNVEEDMEIAEVIEFISEPKNVPHA